MKKLLWISGISALLLVGCREGEENLEDPDGQIDVPTEEIEENEGENTKGLEMPFVATRINQES